MKQGRPPKDKAKTARWAIRVEEDLDERVTAFAAKVQREAADVVRLAVELFLEGGDELAAERLNRQVWDIEPDEADPNQLKLLAQMISRIARRAETLSRLHEKVGQELEHKLTGSGVRRKATR